MSRGASYIALINLDFWKKGVMPIISKCALNIIHSALVLASSVNILPGFEEWLLEIYSLNLAEMFLLNSLHCILKNETGKRRGFFYAIILMA